MRALASVVGALLLAVSGTGPVRGDLLVADNFGSGRGAVLRYDDETGAFLGVFATGLPGDFPVRMTLGPDGDLYVGMNNRQIRRFDGTTGALIGTFTTGGDLPFPADLTFGPDRNLYVASSTPPGRVARYDGTTGVFLDDFVPAGSGGLITARSLAFGPDGNLFVADRNGRQVLRYDGDTGASLDVFARTAGTPSTSLGPQDLVFGPDGNLYVLVNGPASASRFVVERFDGTTGAFLDVFVPDSPGGTDAISLAFGPDGNLYVTTGFIGSSVRRYDGATGAFLDTFVSPESGGLGYATDLLFRPSGAVIPEPGTLTLSAAGLLGLVGYAWRRKRVVSGP